MAGHLSCEEAVLDISDALNRFRGPLVGLITAWGASSADAAEIAQDSFAEAWLNRDNCHGDCSEPVVFGAWLNGVARNCYRQHSRSRQRRERHVTTLEPLLLQDSVAGILPPEDERLERLRLAIQQLPDTQREVILMHYLDETSVNNVAALLSLTPKAVEGRLYQARKALKQMMLNHESDDEEESR